MKHHIDRRAEQVADAIVNAASDEIALNTADAARVLGLSPQWLEIARHRGYGPKYTKLSSRCIRYLRADLIFWLRERADSSRAVA